MQIFLIASTCLIYLVAAGLFSRAVGYFEQQQWDNAVGSDISELGSGPGTYDISKAVWHVNVSESFTLFNPTNQMPNLSACSLSSIFMQNHPYLLSMTHSSPTVHHTIQSKLGSKTD